MFKKILIAIIIITSAIPTYTKAQEQRPVEIVHVGWIKVDGEVMRAYYLQPIPCFPQRKRTNKQMRRYTRLARAVKLTYPIALEAQELLAQTEEKLKTIKDKKEQHKYIKSVEETLKKKYTPILKEMSIYQGMVLLKLIDRQTGNTSYELVKQLRGGFSAFFWQGIARLFGANLKTEYDGGETDKDIEELIILYEMGLL